MAQLALLLPVQPASFAALDGWASPVAGAHSQQGGWAAALAGWLGDQVLAAPAKSRLGRRAGRLAGRPGSWRA